MLKIFDIMENFEKEEWKDIPEYEGYQVSNLGRVKSLERSYRLKEKILKLWVTSNGYYRVQLYKNSIGKFYLVHRLVWEAFNGQIPKNMQVNHINEIKSDNRLENLNLMTPKENTNWGTRNERAGKVLKNRKDQSKPVLQYDLQGILIKEYPSVIQVERETGFANGNIVNCCKGRYKQAYGYIWKYKE